MSPKSPAEPAEREKLRLVIVGHVDHGKSTLVGRLFHDTETLPEGKFEAIKAMCEKRGMPFEWAFLMDALQAERDQGVTIDTSQIWFKTKARDYVLIDAPGHKEFIKNMVTGAAQSDAALLVVDARDGMQQQSRRHGYLLHLLGINRVSVVVNKMDAVDYSETVFRRVESAARDYLGGLGISPQLVVPISAREGDNVANRSDAMDWYDGPTVLEALDAFPPHRARRDLPLRLPVQDIYKFDDRRIVAGRVEAGEIRVGDKILFSPSNKTSHVKSIECWPEGDPPQSVVAGSSTGITLDEQLFIERGELISHAARSPIESDVFRARIFWLAHEPLKAGAQLRMKLNTIECPVRIQAIENIIDTDDLSGRPGDAVERNAAAEVIVRTKRIVPLDNFSDVAATGRFVLVSDYEIVGGGIISMEGYADQRDLITMQSTNVRRVEHRIPVAEREQRNGHRGGVFWFTGLSGAGKSTLALEVERQLFAKGYQVYVLDGDNVRHGLNANLGFSPEDRAENIRRVGEVAALFSRAGTVAISAFISPYRSDRERARRAASDHFHEIYIKADVATCESRDPKGLYKRARAGEIAEFTGVSAPYEAPESPELVVDTAANSIEDCVAQIVDYVDRSVKLNSDS